MRKEPYLSEDSNISPREGNCIPSHIYERIYLSKREFIEIRHCFYKIKSEKKYQILRDTFLLEKHKLYYRRQGEWASYYTTFSPKGLKVGPLEEWKKGRFLTVEYIKRKGKNIAIIVEQEFGDTYYRRYYYFDPKFGIVGIKGRYILDLRGEPCPINWLKLIDKKELDKWIKEYKNNS